jgi:prepilin peptidase CpaA
MLYTVKLAACLTLISLAVSDARFRRLPNLAVAALAGLYCIQAALEALSPAAFAGHLGAGAIALCVSALLFRFGLIGGGDAKLAAAVFLWAGPSFAAPVLFVVSACGLAVGLAVIVAGWASRRFGAPLWLSCFAPVRGVPYGIALAFGGAAAVWAQPAHIASFA